LPFLTFLLTNQSPGKMLVKFETRVHMLSFGLSQILPVAVVGWPICIGPAFSLTAVPWIMIVPHPSQPLLRCLWPGLAQGCLAVAFFLLHEPCWLSWSALNLLSAKMCWACPNQAPAQSTFLPKVPLTYTVDKSA
jgi:hypothetical protein